MKILVTGISGRMGQAVKQAVEQTSGAEIASTHDVGQDITAAMQQAEIAIDFSFHGFTPELLATAVAQGKPLVIGTTGHTAEEKAAISEAAEMGALAEAAAPLSEGKAAAVVMPAIAGEEDPMALVNTLSYKTKIQLIDITANLLKISIALGLDSPAILGSFTGEGEEEVMPACAE